jgi:hypothetical protein
MGPSLAIQRDTLGHVEFSYSHVTCSFSQVDVAAVFLLALREI